MRKFIIVILSVIAIVSYTAPAAQCCNRIVVCQDDDLVKVFSSNNTRFIINEDLNLDGKKIKIGEGCTLVFHGGSLSNGTIVGNNTRVKAINIEIFKRGCVRYRAYIKSDASKNDRPTLIKQYHNCLIIEGTWNNNHCGSNWTGLMNDSKEDVMLAVRNYVVLHKKDAYVVFPTFNAFGYESTKLPGGYIIDFNNSSISYPDDLDAWVDKSIAIPDGSIVCSLESGYGLISTNSNTTIKNLYIDGKSTFRPGEPIRLGVSCIISIGDAKNVILDNVSISNVLGPAVTAQSGAKDLLFKNCRFYNIGEHVVYSHQYLGYCHFEKCIFDTWDSERLSVYRDGLDYLYKYTPPFDKGVASYEEIYGFDLCYSGCTFINPSRVNSQGRTLGGFFTGTFPVVIKLIDCKFTGAATAISISKGSVISEESKTPFRIIMRGCDGAPYIHTIKTSYNIITEYYNSVNIPFRTVFAKRYEGCQLYLDLYESNIENVTSSFEAEFSEPLIIKECELYDKGNDVRINHPVFHRPVIFDNCKLLSTVRRDNVSNVVTIKKDSSLKVTFKSCLIDMPTYRLVGGNYQKDNIDIIDCDIKAISLTRN